MKVETRGQLIRRHELKWIARGVILFKVWTTEPVVSLAPSTEWSVDEVIGTLTIFGKFELAKLRLIPETQTERELVERGLIIASPIDQTRIAGVIVLAMGV